MPSSVVSIPNQPLIFSAPSTDECNCGERNQCVLVVPDQQLFSQFKLQPCGTVEVCNNSLGNELICNGGFDLGAELVTNGTFNGDASGWTFGGTWAYGTNNICSISSDGGETLSQTIGIVNGSLYYVVYTVEDHNGDGGDIRVELGGTNGASFTADGTYSALIVAGAGSDIVFNNVGIDFTGCITDVSVRLLDCWTFGLGWTWSAGAACNDVGANSLDQTISAGLVNGAEYLLTFDITNYTSGDLAVILGGNLFIPDFAANGTYSVVVTSGPGGDLRFDSDPDFIGCIDNVSLKQITSCWDADETDWITSVDGACHVAGNTTDLTNTGTVLTVGLYYHITFVVSGATAGGVTLRASSAFGAQTSGNGTFERWGTADGTALFFRPSLDFDGCVSAIEVVQYNLNSVFHLLTSDGDFVADITGSVNYENDIAYLDAFNINNIVEDNYGCYKICMIDGCYGDLAQLEANLIENGDFAAGGANWTSVDTVFAAGTATISSEGYIEQNTKNIKDVGCFRIQFDWTNEGGEGNINIFVNGFSEHTAILSGGSGTIDFTTPRTPNAGALIRIYAEPNLASVIIDNVVISVPDECRVYDQCSPCIKYAASFACTKMVEGYCDGNAFKFTFDDVAGNNIFKLSLRAKCELLHPAYPEEQDDYTFSTGTSSLNYFESTEYESLVFHPIPKYKHRVIRLIKGCDTVQIDTVNYFVRKGDYVAEWNKSTNADLAPSRIEVKLKDQTLFNTNCQ